jgi:hypothetical protein
MRRVPWSGSPSRRNRAEPPSAPLAARCPAEFIVTGTDSSNPVPSSGESTNHRFRRDFTPSGATPTLDTVVSAGKAERSRPRAAPSGRNTRSGRNLCSPRNPVLARLPARPYGPAPMGFGSSRGNTAPGTGWGCLPADGGGSAQVPS